MLKKAREQFPQVNFVQQAATQLDLDAAFDGACSFSSLLYLDPIDFYNAVYRLYQAIKPGGLLFLYGLDTGPDWRGEPFNIVIGKWMWGLALRHGRSCRAAGRARIFPGGGI